MDSVLFLRRGTTIVEQIATWRCHFHDTLDQHRQIEYIKANEKEMIT